MRPTLRPSWVALALIAALITVPLSCATAREVPDTRSVVLVLQRNSRMGVFDAQTLEPIGAFLTGPLGDDFSVRPDGRMVFLLQADVGDPRTCCSLQALDLATHRMCPLGNGGAPVVSTDRIAFASGSATFDAHTLSQRGTPPGPARGSYHVRPSPDGRWLFSIWNDLQLLDADRSLVRELTLPTGSVEGDWIGDRYYLVGNDGIVGHVWGVTSSDTGLGEPLPVTWPGFADKKGKPVAFSVRVAGGQLAVFKLFGAGLHMVIDDPDQARDLGGAFVIDPTGANPPRRILPNLFFRALVGSSDGKSLYAIQDWPSGVPVRFMRIDASTGAVLAETTMHPREDPAMLVEEWSLAYVNMPVDLVPSGDVTVRSCR